MIVMTEAIQQVDFDESKFPVEEYEDLVRKFMPGYDGFYALCEIVLAEDLPERAEVLIVGAGGGKEISAFGKAFPGAQFVGVDPSEKMLAVARARTEKEDLQARVTLVRGSVDDVDENEFAAATALLVMHFLPDNGEKLRFLESIARRLKPGAKFIIADGCFDKSSKDFEWLMQTYQNHARRNGAPEEVVAEADAMIREKVFCVPEQRELELLRAAGFGEVRRVFQGLWFTAFVAERL
jgi:tRNA (cmo5U34)-methyltransferase